jgi:hypothetical protein
LSRQVSQNFCHIPVFLRLSGRRKILDHVDFPPISRSSRGNASEGFEFRWPTVAVAHHPVFLIRSAQDCHARSTPVQRLGRALG